MSLPKTLRPHEMRAQATDFKAHNMRDWYAPHDFLGYGDGVVLPEITLEEAILRIATTAVLSLTDRDDDLLSAKF